MKKPKNGSSDDFDFMDGGLDEFFPLENTGKTDGPPKGVKGYLKNVVKSVANLGVRVNKTLYPDVFEVGSGFKDAFSEDGNSIDIKGTIRKYKDMAKGAYKESQIVANEIANDAKTAFKTGKFVKGENEDNELDDMLGSMFGGDYESDSLDFGSDFGDDSSDSNEKSSKKGRITAGEATIKSSVASTKAILRSNQKQRAAIMGAAQSHIRHETELFAQQMEIEQQRHKQKMSVMRNIATNLAKVIKQNNIKLKAQMEFSAKSLAFAQDTAAMLKEIRNAQWAMVKPDKKDDMETSGHAKAFGRFGNSWNVSSWIKQMGTNWKNRSGGMADMFSMFNDSMNMMSDMGMKRSTVIKNMIGDFVFDSIVKGAISSKTARNIDLFNLKTQGAGTAINKQLGKISRGDNKLLNNLSRWADNKGGLLGSLVGKGISMIQNAAGKAHIYDEAVYQTDRYKMGDPDKVHPFDNKAHKVLTEVIPAYLSKISAGVNHTEEQLFDFSLNRFVSSKVVKESYKNAKNSPYEETRGIDTYREKFVQTNSYGSKHDFDKDMDIMMRNWLRSGRTFDEEEIRKVRFHGKTFGEYSQEILDGTTISEIDDMKIACDKFYNAIKQMRPRTKAGSTSQERDTWTQFVTSAYSYNSRLGDSMLDNETNISQNISSIQHSTVSNNDQIERDRVETLRNIERIEKKLNGKNGKDKFSTKARLSLINELESHKRHLVELNSRSQESVAGINENIGFSNYSGSMGKIDSFSDYRIHALEDSSTHGIIQNIYNLLLSGIDVYTTPKEHSPKERNEFMKSTKSKIVQKYKTDNELNKLTEINQQYNKFNGFCPSDPKELKTFLINNDIYDSDGKVKYTGRVYWEEKGKMVSSAVEQMEGKWKPKTQYYFKINEYNAWWNKYRREADIASYGPDGYDDAGDNWLHKVPIIGGLFKAFNKFQNFKAELGSKLLGNALYGEKNNFNAEKQAFNNAKDKVVEGAKAYGADIKEEGFKEATAKRAKLALKIAQKREKQALDELKKRGVELKNRSAEEIDKLIIDNLGQETYDKIKIARDKAKNVAASVTATVSSTVKTGTSTIMNVANKQKQSFTSRLLSGRLASMKVGKVTLSETIAKINSPTLTTYFAKEKDPIAKAKYLLDNIQTYPQLDIFKDKLTEFVSAGQSSGAMGVLATMGLERINKIKDRLKSTGNKLLNRIFAKKDIKKLMSITVNGVTLKEVINSDSSLTRAVSVAFARAERAGSEDGSLTKYGEELLKIENTKLEPYKAAIQEWIANSKDRIGGLNNKIGNFADKIIDKIMNKVDQIVLGKDREGNKLPLIGSKLSAIEGITTGTKLGDVIEDICAGIGITELMRHTKNEFVKAKLLLRTVPTDNQQFEEFRLPIQQFIDQQKAELKSKGKEKAKQFAEYARNKGIDLKNMAKDEKDKLFAKFNSENSDEEDELELEDQPDKRSTKLSKLMSKGSGVYRSVLDKAGNFKRKRGLLGAVGGIASGIVTGIGNIFNKDDEGPVKGDKASEQNKIKLEKKKEKEQKKKDKEEKKFRDTLLKFFRKNEKGIHLDEKQVDGLKKSNKKSGDGGGDSLWDKAKNFLWNPTTKTALATLFGGVAGGVILNKVGNKVGQNLGDRGRQIQNMLHGDQENYLWNNKAYNNAEQGKNVLGSTGAVAGTLGGAAVANQLAKGVGKGKNFLQSKALDKASAAAEKMHLKKLSNNLSKKATKAAERSAKYGKNLSVANSKKMFGRVGKAAAGALAGSSIASNIAEKAGLEGNAAKMATAAGAVAGAASGNIIINLFNKIAKKLEGEAAKMMIKIASKIVSVLPKIGQKAASAVANVAGSTALIIGKIILAVAKFADGMTEDTTKKNFQMGKGMGVTMGMRLASGLKEVLMFLPIIDILLELLCSVLGYPNFAYAIYDWCGGEAEKNALARYQAFQTDRAKLYGVTRDQLTAYEQRFQPETGYGKAKKAVKDTARKIGNLFAGGIAAVANAFGADVKADDIVRSNEKLASDLLGFADKKIYKYWKDNKYDPMEEGATDIAKEECGSLKAFASFIAPAVEDLDSDGDGNVTKEELEKAEMYQALQKQAQARVKILKYMQNYVLENKLAWLNNKLTLDKFEKYLAKTDERKASVIAEKKAKHDESVKSKRTAEQDKQIQEAIERGEMPGGFFANAMLTSAEKQRLEEVKRKKRNEETTAIIKSTVQKTNNFINKVGNWVKNIYKEYNFSPKEEAIMDSASAAIQSVHTNVDPTFYGENAAANISPSESNMDNNSVVHVGGNGGPETAGTNEGFFVKVKEVAGKAVSGAKTVGQKVVNGVKNTVNKVTSSNSNTYDLSGQTPKNVVMNSIVSDFAKNFGNDLIKRLNILEEMHKENLRHNKVSEDFFKACLAMMSQIAKSSGNNSMGSKLDDMMAQIVR